MVTDLTGYYPVSITLNGLEFINLINPKTNSTQLLLFAVPIIVKTLEPAISFDNAQNIQVSVQADTLFDLSTLTCKIHDYVTPGSYFESDGLTYTNCIIPSYEFIKLTKENPINADNTIAIEVSNNGIDYS